MPSIFTPERRWPVMLGVTLFCAGLLVSTLNTSSVGAAGACRADPIVTLSNGVVLQLYADIANDPANVQQVTYALHGPLGTTALSAVIPADDPLWGKEQFVYYADGKDTKYTNDLQVSVADGAKTKVTAYINGQDEHGNPHIWKHDGDTTKPIEVVADIKTAAAAHGDDKPSAPQPITPKHDTSGDD